MNAERLLARYERIVDTPDAVTQLRRFILDLAVRGKLVPQDPHDEPASKLLRKIDAEKLRLGVKGVLDTFSIDEVPFALPSGWAWTCVGAICSKTGSGSTPTGGKEVYKTSGVPFLRSQNIYSEGLTDRTICFNQQINAVTPYIDGVHRFIALALKAQDFQELAWSKAGTGTLPIISKGKWEILPVPLPPLAEQQRIVAKVDELMSLCDGLEAGLSTCESVRGRLLDALLHEALEPVAGELEAA